MNLHKYGITNDYLSQVFGVWASFGVINYFIFLFPSIFPNIFVLLGCLLLNTIFVIICFYLHNKYETRGIE